MKISDIGAMMQEIQSIVGDMQLTHVENRRGAFIGWLFTACPYGDAEPLERSMDSLDLVHEVGRRARESRRTPLGARTREEPVELKKRIVGGKPAVEVWLWTPTKR